jgi:hypothetical protein
MSFRKKAKKLAGRAGVALATTGLSACRFGPVDPPPAPFACGLGGATELNATATVTGTELAVKIFNHPLAQFIAVRITSVVGGSARPVHLATNPLTVVIDLTDETVKSGSFTLSGTLHGVNSSNSCAVTRTFTFSLDSGQVVIALAEELPLAERESARIALVSRQGHQVELEATTPFDGAATLTWTVTGGEVLSQEGTRLSWLLPAEAGLYQAELVVDYGPRGLSFDALALEVSGDNSSREESS